MSVDQLFSASLGLSDDERVNLAIRMLNSVGDAAWDPPEWLQDQVAERVERLRAGLTQAIPAEEALAAARETLKKRHRS